MSRCFIHRAMKETPAPTGWRWFICLFTQQQVLRAVRGTGQFNGSSVSTCHRGLGSFCFSITDHSVNFILRPVPLCLWAAQEQQPRPLALGRLAARGRARAPCGRSAQQASLLSQEAPSHSAWNSSWPQRRVSYQGALPDWSLRVAATGVIKVPPPHSNISLTELIEGTALARRCPRVGRGQQTLLSRRENHLKESFVSSHKKPRPSVTRGAMSCMV